MSLSLKVNQENEGVILLTDEATIYLRVRFHSEKITQLLFDAPQNVKIERVRLAEMDSCGCVCGEINARNCPVHQ